MKHLLLLCLMILPLHIQASAHDDFQTRVEWVKELKTFVLDYEAKNAALLTAHEKNLLHRFSLFEEALASGNYDCFFAGWPSKLVSSNGKRLCTNPARGNSEYQKGSCSTGQLQCQPVIFGKGLCVGFSSPKDKQMAFASCESKFKQKGSYDFLKTMSAEDKAALKEVSSLAHKVCVDGSVGVQKSKPMCKSLMSKFKNATLAIDRTPAATEEVEEESEVQKVMTSPAISSEIEGTHPKLLVETPRVSHKAKLAPALIAELDGIHPKVPEIKVVPKHEPSAPVKIEKITLPVVEKKEVKADEELIPIEIDLDNNPAAQECKDDVVVDAKVVENAEDVLKTVNHEAESQYEKIKKQFQSSPLCSPECTFISEDILKQALIQREALLKSPNGSKITNPDEITIVDYSRPSNARRLFVIDLKASKVLHHTWSSKLDSLDGGILYSHR